MKLLASIISVNTDLYLQNMKTQQKSTIETIKYGVCSFLATYIAGVLHPLDVIKTRFQSHDGKAHHENLVPKYHGVGNAFYEIYRLEGIKGLYKGFHLSIFSQAAATSFFFWLYELRKIHYESQNHSHMNSVALASIQAGLIATMITQPVWVVKTRMLLNVRPRVGEFENMFEKVRQIYGQGGLRGFMKGIMISNVLALTALIQMYVYEGSKMLYDKLPIPQTRFSEKNFFCGGLAKIISTVVFYPLTTIRTRIQQNQFIPTLSKNEKYKNIFEITNKTWKHEGLRGFYKGFTANVMKGIPQKGVYFYFYQLLKKLLFNINDAHKEIG